MRTIGNPDLAGAHDQECTVRQVVSMLLQHGIELFDLRLQRSAWEPEEDDASVSEAPVEDQLAEIAIGNHENALLSLRDCENLLISKAVWVVLGNSRDIVAKLAKMRDEAKVSALVEEKSHTGVASETARFGGFGETSSPVTIAFA
jgi:hypothetical protein